MRNVRSKHAQRMKEQDDGEKDTEERKRNEE